MNVQKVKEAIAHIRKGYGISGVTLDNCEDFENGIGAIDYIEQELAELEKPVDDSVAEKIIQQYAESYHAKQCIHCQKIVYCEKCGDPISVGYCENCIPEERKA